MLLVAQPCSSTIPVPGTMGVEAGDLYTHGQRYRLYGRNVHDWGNNTRAPTEDAFQAFQVNNIREHPNEQIDEQCDQTQVCNKVAFQLTKTKKGGINGTRDNLLLFSFTAKPV